MTNKKNKISFHFIFIILALAIILVVLIRLNAWNKRSVTVDTDVADDAYEMECQDYYVYPDAEAIAKHEDNGIEDILIIGNSILSNQTGEKSVFSSLSQQLNANIYSLIADNSKITSNQKYDLSITDPTDGASLYRVIDMIVNKNVTTYAEVSQYPGTIFNYNEQVRAEEYCKTVDNLDLDKIDTVIIMYSLLDYYNVSPTLVIPNEDINCYYGALYSSITLLQERYPHLSIIISSPVPGYIYEDDQLVLTSTKDFGTGNASAYIDMQYYVATKCCVSYIDNYFYTINEKNITDYIDGFYLSDKGIELVTNHMLEFLNKR